MVTVVFLVLEDARPVLAVDAIQSFGQFSKDEMELELGYNVERQPHPYLDQARESEREKERERERERESEQCSGRGIFKLS